MNCAIHFAAGFRPLGNNIRPVYLCYRVDPGTVGPELCGVSHSGAGKFKETLFLSVSNIATKRHSALRIDLKSGKIQGS